MNVRSSGAAACLLVAVTAGCGTVTASPPGGGAHSTASAAGATASAVPASASAVPASASAVPASASAAATRPSQASGAPNAGTGLPPNCQRPVNDVLTLASNGKTYCIRVGEKFEVYLRGTLSSRWLVPLASSDVIRPVPNGALSLIAGLTGESFAGVRPGRVLITSVRLPCPGAVMERNEAQPKGPLTKTYRLVACAPQHRFSVSIIVLS